MDVFYSHQPVLSGVSLGHLSGNGITLTIKCRLKMPQGLAARQLGIKHGDKLTPATQLSDSIIALVAFDGIIKSVFWDKA
jgi:hypothetical protein